MGADLPVPPEAYTKALLEATPELPQTLKDDTNTLIFYDSFML